MPSAKYTLTAAIRFISIRMKHCQFLATLLVRSYSVLLPSLALLLSVGFEITAGQPCICKTHYTCIYGVLIALSLTVHGPCVLVNI